MLEQNKIYLGDNLELLKQLDDNSIHSCVSDFPYNLGFMGKKWDTISDYYHWCYDRAIELLRVLKPGGYCLIFGGTRTHHRLGCAFEDAGFEIKDELHWGYSSGMPKSLDISKQFDKIYPRMQLFEKFAKHFSQQLKNSNIPKKEIQKLFPSKNGKLTGCVWNWEHGNNIPTLEQWKILKPLLNLSDEFAPIIEREELERKVIGKRTDGRYKYNFQNGTGYFTVHNKENDIKTNIDKIGLITEPTSDLAKQWDGWGTALKPSFEPIVMCQKPIEKNYCTNIDKYGVGAINIKDSKYHKNLDKSKELLYPANTILTDDILEEYSKFFMIPKSNKKDKTESGLVNNTHTTVKPTELIKYLVKLVTPPKGICLDICEGSGTHVKAVLELNKEGFDFNYIGFENDEDSYKIACERENINKVF